MIIRGIARRDAPPQWIKGEARIEGNWLVLDATRRQVYQPMSEHDLLFDLADVHTPTDAITFIRKYGLLWHGPLDTDHTEQFSEWEKEALTLRGCLLLYKTLYDATHETGKDQKYALERLWTDWEPNISSFFQGRVTTDEELLIQASKTLAWTISEKLEGTEESVTSAAEWESSPGSGSPGPPGVFLFTAHPPNLLGYIYHQLAMLVVNRVPLIRCEECGRVFKLTHKLTRFCSNACAVRSRKRRFERKKSQKQNEQIGGLE